MALKRPFKVTYYERDPYGKVGRVCPCSTPEAVVRTAALRLIRGDADFACVNFDDEPFAEMVQSLDGGGLHFTVF
jgi:hypothetical protein